MTDSPAERVARLLLHGVTALREDRVQEAVEALTGVCADPDLKDASDLADVRARALSLLADACLRAGQVDRADSATREALRILRASGDAAGVAEVQSVWARVTTARQDAASEIRHKDAAERLRGTSLRELRERYGGNPTQLADVLIKKANAEAEDGSAQIGLVAAEEALELGRQSQSIRSEVFALLSIARLAPERAKSALLNAWKCAERANEFNLVGAVARAADAQEIRLPAQVGPDLRRVADKPTPRDDASKDPMG